MHISCFFLSKFFHKCIFDYAVQPRHSSTSQANDLHVSLPHQPLRSLHHLSPHFFRGRGVKLDCTQSGCLDTFELPTTSRLVQTKKHFDSLRQSIRPISSRTDYSKLRPRLPKPKR